METKLQGEITSFLDYLLKNQKALHLYFGKGEDVIKYLGNQTKYYNDYYEEHYKFDENKNYRQTDLFQINSEIARVKDEIEKIISKNLADKYNVSGFLQYIARLKKLEEQKQNFERVKNQTERVENLFGRINLKNKVVGKKGVEYVDKTSDELTIERKEKLAVLNQLYSSGKMEESEFINNVVAVRKCYQIVLESCIIKETEKLASETAKVEKPTEKIKNKVRACVNSVKKVFKIGKPETNLKEELAEEQAKKNVANLGAFEAVSKVRDLLNSSHSEKATEERRECFEDMISINSDIPQLVISNQLENEFMEMINVNENEVLESYIVELTRPIIKKYNGSLKVKTKKELSNDMIRFTNFMQKKYKNKRDITLNENGGFNLTIHFEDMAVQKTYDEAMQMFSYVSNQIQLCEKYQKQIDTQVQNIVDKQVGVSISR